MVCSWLVQLVHHANTIQSLFGRHAVLAALGLRPSAAAATVLDSGYTGFEPTFKAMWADNADVLSQLYSGTGALKTDFTRSVAAPHSLRLVTLTTRSRAMILFTDVD